MPELAVLMTTHNRSDVTLRCLRGLESALRAADGWTATLYLADDGSSDGTPDLVLNQWPWHCDVIRGVGDWYWAAGMAVAQSMALSSGHPPDFVLLLNDDVDLEPDAVVRALQRLLEDPSIALVGAVRDSSSGETTYSGLRRIRSRPTALRMVPPDPIDEQRVDSFHGNFVLLSINLLRQADGLDGGFAHAYADIDLGLRLNRLGVPILLMSGHVGSCARNSDVGTWLDPGLPRVRRLRLIFDRKAMPIRSQFRFVSRHGRAMWPIYLCGNYASAIALVLRRRTRPVVLIDTQNVGSVPPRSGAGSRGDRPQS